MIEIGSPHRLTLKVKPDLSSASETLQEVAEFFQTHAVDSILGDQIILILDELVTNCINYGQKPGNEFSIFLDIHLTKKEVEIILRDNGVPFDPTDIKEPDIETPIEDRKIGGLGIHLVRKLSDTFAYQRTADFNEIKVTKKLQKI